MGSNHVPATNRFKNLATPHYRFPAEIRSDVRASVNLTAESEGCSYSTGVIGVCLHGGNAPKTTAQSHNIQLALRVFTKAGYGCARAQV